MIQTYSVVITEKLEKSVATKASCEYKDIKLCGSTPQKSKPAPDKSR